MKRTVLAFIFALTLSTLAAQTVPPKLTLAAPTTPITPGAKVSIDVILTGNELDGAGLSALDFTLSAPGFTATSTVLGKVLTCAGSRCMLVGDDPQNINATVIANGTVATLVLTMPAAPVTLTLPALHAVAGLSGNEVAITGNTSITLNPTRPCDVTGDGLVDSTDVAAFVGLFIAESNGLGACGVGDINGNGTCDSIDLQRIINAAKGGACKTGR